MGNTSCWCSATRTVAPAICSARNWNSCTAGIPEVQVLLISRGEVEANRQKVQQYQLTFPVVLQHSWEISRLYAMFGTPIGYLIDVEGMIAADVAVGAESILALLSGRAAATNGQSRKAVPRT